MKKYSKTVILLCASVLLFSCNQDEIDQLNNRIEALENVTIASVNQQIASIKTTITSLQETDSGLKDYITSLQETSAEFQNSINANGEKINQVEAELKENLSIAKVEVLAELQSLQTTMQGQLTLINESLDSLRKNDKVLESRINDLKTYVDNEIKSTKDWASATFSTLDQYNQTITEIAAIKVSIESINTALTSLEERINDKIAKDIKTASDALEASIAQKTAEITASYSTAISQAKGEIESAYKNAIQTAITNSESTMRAWVNGRLTGYYTIAETDSKIATLSSELNTKIESQKAYFEGLINALSEEVDQKINDNKALISSLRSNLTTLQGEVASNTLLIASNAEAISDNAASIAANAIAISNNASSIESNATLIAANKKAVADNATMISQNAEALAALGSEASVTAKNVADNAKTIADNAALISANSVVINNNAQAIADNATDIARLYNDLNKAKTDLTTEYTQAIQSAIDELNGKMDASITAKITAVNQSIVDALNSRIDGMESKILALEGAMATVQSKVSAIITEINGIQETITKLINRIQSVSYIPRYTDNMMRLGVYAKADHTDGKVVVGDFEIQPHNLADSLIANPSVLSMKAVYTITKSSMFMDMPIVKATKAEEGVITIEAACDNIGVENLAFDKSFSVALSISNENANYTSTYIQVNRKPVIKFADPIVMRALLKYGVDKDNDGQISFEECDQVVSFLDLYKYYDAVQFNGGRGRLLGESFQELKYFYHLDKIAGYIGSLNVYLPESLSIIGAESFHVPPLDYYFYGNPENSQLVSSLYSSITIPDSVETIGKSAFAGLNNLTALSLSSTSHLSLIDSHAFDGTGLEIITLPQSLTIIGDYAFNACSNLKTVTLLGKTPPTISKNTFSNVNLVSIYVPQDAIATYKTQWSQYSGIIKPIQ